MTYKLTPGAQPVAITQSYGPERAAQVLAAAIEDYNEQCGAPHREA
jgi:hypothetical protein